MPPRHLGLFHLFEVYRDDFLLGTLEWVKKSFHYWRQQKDLESLETGIWFRNRMPKKKLPKGLVYKGKTLLVGRWIKRRGGQRRRFVPHAKQSQFLPRG